MLDTRFLDPMNLVRAIVSAWEQTEEPGAEEHINQRAGYTKLKRKIKKAWAMHAGDDEASFPWTDDVVKKLYLRWRKKTKDAKADMKERLAHSTFALVE